MVVAGRALAEVSATGAHSEIGRIGAVLDAIEAESTPLHRQTRQLVRWFSALGLVVSVIVGALFAWSQGDWLGATLAGITMALSMLPQEFLLILTVFMAMGAWRLSQHRVLTRRAALQARNRALWGMVLATVALLATVVGVAPLRRLFGFAIPEPMWVGAALGVGAATLAVLLTQRALRAALSRARGRGRVGA
ncbi:Calcium-transporting ATPase [Thauera sp. GDN1]|nr:Calcium-transporting ATPase [Thauera sp. GDN1]